MDTGGATHTHSDSNELCNMMTTKKDEIREFFITEEVRR